MPARPAYLHRLQVLAIWAAATALTFLLARLGAQDTPATPWGGAAPDWLTHMSFWDSGWYERIWREGYPSTLPVNENGTIASNAWAFLPLFPFLASALTAIGVPFYAAACLVSVVSSAACALLADAWLAPRVGARASLWATALFFANPCALILQTGYAESLGLALLLAGFLLLERRRHLAAAPFLGLACLARPMGAPLTLTLLAWSALEWRSARAAGGRASWAPFLLTLETAALTTAWPLAAWAVTGTPQAYTASETSWRAGGLLPVAQWVIRGGTWAGSHLAVPLFLAIFALMLAFLALPAWRRLGRLPWLWCASYLLYLLAVFDPTTSLFRLLMPLLPAAWAWAGSLRLPSPANPTSPTEGEEVTQGGAAASGIMTLAGYAQPVAVLALSIAGQILWIAWVWDLGSISMNWVP